MKEFPFISVVIAVYNAERTMAKCLKSIIAQNYPFDKYEIITVDDSSDDDTPKKIKSLMKKHDCIKYIRIPHSGYSMAEKIGMKMAKGDLIFLTNSDCYVPKNWFRRLMDGFDSEDIGGVGGGIKHVGDCYHFSWGRLYENKKIQVYALAAFNSCFRRDVISKIGFIDEKTQAEDVDLSLRVIMDGYKLIRDPFVLVEHDHPLHSSTNMIKKNFYYAKSLVSTLKKHNYPPFFSLRFLLMSVAIFIFPFILFPLALKELYISRMLIKEYRGMIKKYNLKIPLLKLTFLRVLRLLTTLLGSFYYFIISTTGIG